MLSILHYLSVSIAVLNLVSAYPLAPNIGPYGVHFYNNNSQTMHISADWAEKDIQAYGSQVTWDYSPIAPGGHIFIPGFPTTSPKFFIGLTPNQKTAEIGDKRNHDTAVEITFKGGHDWTYYDVDIEKGFSSPVWCHGEGEEWETGQGCTADLLAQCPEQDRHFDETGLYDQCVAAETEDNLGLRLSLCPDVYVRYDDHKTKTSNGKNSKWSSHLLTWSWVELTFCSSCLHYY